MTRSFFGIHYVFRIYNTWEALFFVRFHVI